MQYTLDGQQYYHIKEFANLTGLSVQAIRYLCFTGNSARKLTCIYEGSRLYILASELVEFPFMKGGHAAGLRGIYHYKLNEEGKWVRYLCEVCTQGTSYNHHENMFDLSALESR